MPIIKNITTHLPDECMVINWDLEYEVTHYKFSEGSFRTDLLKKINKVTQTIFGIAGMDITEIIVDNPQLLIMAEHALLNEVGMKEIEDIGGIQFDVPAPPPVKITLHELTKTA